MKNIETLFRNLDSLLRSKKNFWIFIGLLALLRMIYILFIPITPQEAYYWYYSTKPALSYFDHPPLVAYSIWIGTTIFGENVFGVKFMGIIWSILTNIVLYFTTYKVADSFEIRERYRLSFISVILFNLTIFSHLYSLITVPDTPLLFFWMVIIYSILEYQANKNIGFLYLAGAALGFGLLSKYTIVAILPAILIFFLSNSNNRKIFLSTHLYLSLLLSIIIFLPVIIWNSQHNWASFLFQFSNRAGEMRKITHKYILQLLISQIFLLTPFVFYIFLKIPKYLSTHWKTQRRLLFLFLTGIFIIGGFITVSITSLVKMNWLMPGYLGLTICSVLIFKSKISYKSKWFKTGLYSSIFLILLAHMIYIIPNFPLGEGNTWSGWKDASNRIFHIQKDLGGKNRCFIFTNGYKSASLIRFYLQDRLETYAQNIYGESALQFDIWGVPDSLLGKNGLYVFSDRKEYHKGIEKLKPHFDEIIPITKFDYDFGGIVKTRSIYCYLATNYHKPKIN
jgi:hypothetical protein